MDSQALLKLEALLRHLLATAGIDVSAAFRVHAPGSTPHVTVEFTGKDVPHLLARNAELLLAFEHIAAKTLRLEPEQHDQISFDAGGFKASRERMLQRSAEKAVQQVRLTGRPYAFPPMNSRERRLLHLALAPSGLVTASEGEGPTRHLVLHPKRG